MTSRSVLTVIRGTADELVSPQWCLSGVLALSGYRNHRKVSQLREPNRYRGPYGAGQAAAQSGNRDKARHHFSKLIELAGSGDLRPEMEAARRYLAAN